MKFILGKKIGMTSFFGPTGREFAVTVVQAGPCSVVAQKTKEKDSYNAVQLGFMDIPEKRVNKPLLGMFKKANVTPKKYLREFRCDDPSKFQVGDEIDCSVVEQGSLVTVTGYSKGKGFQGTVKRWNMALQGMSHGTHESKRGPGSIGMCADPARVIKGKHMAGRMGNEKKTVKNIEVLKVLKEENIIFLVGSVPGGKNSLLKIRVQGD